MVSIIDLFINWKDGNFYFSVLDFGEVIGSLINIGYCDGKFYGDFLFGKWIIGKVKELIKK